MPINSKESALKALSEVDSQYSFYMCNGAVIKSLSELAGALKEANQDVYSYHANSEKNDFSNWISDIVGDKKLASELQKEQNLKGALSVVKKRVDWLKKKSK